MVARLAGAPLLGGRRPVGQRQVVRRARGAAGRARRRRAAGQRGLDAGAAAPGRAPAADARACDRRRAGGRARCSSPSTSSRRSSRSAATRPSAPRSSTRSSRWARTPGASPASCSPSAPTSTAAARHIPTLVAAARRQPRARRPDAARRAAARDRAPARRAACTSSPSSSTACSPTSRVEPGALPLLSTALLELWQRRDGRTLRLAAYEQTGGVRGAVARLAEAAYGRLDPRQQAVARRILLRLAGEDVGGAAVRRRVALDELDADRDDDVARVLDVLAASRLVTLSDGTAEVAHEALLREWPRLRGWLERGRRGPATAPAPGRSRRANGTRADATRASSTAALGWPSHARLERRARAPSSTRSSAPSWTPAAPQSERRGAPRAAHEPAPAHAARRRRRPAGARRERRRAVPRPARRRPAARRAPPRRSGSAPKRSSSDDLDRSLLLARQGVALEDSLADAQQPARRAHAQPGRHRRHAASTDVRLSQLALRPDGRALVVGDDHGNVPFLDPVTRRRLRPPYRPQPSYIRQLVFSPDGSRLAVGGVGMIDLLDGRTFRRVAIARRSRRRLPVHQRRVLARRARPGRDVRDARAARPDPAVEGDPAALRRPHRASARPPVVSVPETGSLADVAAFGPDGRWLRHRRAGHRRSFPGATRDRSSTGVRSSCATRGPCGRCAASRGCGRGRPLPGRADVRRRRRRRLRALPRPAHGAAATASGRHEAAVRSALFTADGRFLVTVGQRRERRSSGTSRRLAAVETLEGHAGRMVGAWPSTAARARSTPRPRRHRDHVGPRWAIAASAARSTLARTSGDWFLRRRSAATGARSPCSRPTAR